MTQKKKISFLAVGVLALTLTTAFALAMMRQTPATLTTQEPEAQITGPATEITPQNQTYLPYSSQTYEATKGKKRVLFFAANWCPTCRAADQDFSQNLDKIPSDIVILKVDYDTATDLKSTYNIVTQHTFVLVDMQGDEITRWNGGGLEELLRYTYTQ